MNTPLRRTDKKRNVEGLKVRMKLLCEGLIRNMMLNGLKVSMKFLCEELIRNVMLRG